MLAKEPLRIVPNHFYPYFLMRKLFIKKRNEENSSEIASPKEPEMQSTAVEEMREEARKIKDKK